MIYVFIFIIGTVFGSFANVCIKRIPRSVSIVKPGSACRSCKKPIKWHDNIPVISYLVLKGKCRSCGAEISPAYPLVEFITGLLFLAVFYKFGGYGAAPAVIFLVFAVLNVIISGIDIEHRIIPDVLSLILVISGVLFSPWNTVLNYGLPNCFEGTILSKIAMSVSGLIIAGLIYVIIAFLGENLFRQEALGGGDIKLIAGIGAYMGTVNVLWVIFFASIFGAIAGLMLILSGKKKRKDIIPYGPYISAAAIFVILFQPRLNEIYYRYMMG